MIEHADEKDPEPRRKYFIIEVKNSLNVIKVLETQFDQANYDNLCFTSSVRGKITIDCKNIEEIYTSCYLV